MRVTRTRIAVLLIALLGALRFAHWDAPVLGDESYQITFFVNKAPAEIVAAASDNHILFTLILHAVNAASHKELLRTLTDTRALRALDEAASVLSLILTYLLAVELTNPLAAIPAVALFGVSYWPLLYSHRLRGYSFTMCLNLISAWLVLRVLRGRLRWAWLLPIMLAATNYAATVGFAYGVALAAGTFLALALPGIDARRRKSLALAAAFAAGAALTYAAYRPLLAGLAQVHDQLRAQGTAASFRDAAVWKSYFRVLGLGTAFPAIFGAVSACGLIGLLRRRGRPRRAGALIAAYVLVPPLLLALKGDVTRVFINCLPFWAMAFAAALSAGAAAFRRSYGLPRRSVQFLVLAATAAVLLAAGGQVRSFLSWNRGVDPRRACLAVLADTRDTDDFVMIADERGDPSDSSDPDWSYYAWAANLYPGLTFNESYDFPYLIRSRYYVVAADEAAARRTLKRSGVDEILAKRLALFLANGRTSVFKLTFDEKTLADYRVAAGARRSSRAQRVRALDGLGYDAIRDGRYGEAISFLELAKRLAPQDRKTRYLLGRAYYLSFDDEKAGAEFEWIVARDTENIHAPLYYGDTLAGRGRDGEAVRAYSFYNSGTDRLYLFQKQAQLATEAIQGGRAPRGRADGRYKTVSEVVDAYISMGSYDRAEAGIANVLKTKPSPESWPVLYWYSALAADGQRHYAGAASALRRGLAVDGGNNFKILLAKELELKFDEPQARRLTDEVLASEPGNEQALVLKKELQRL
ncbi:MAG: hypothetical protein ACHQ49_01540 [Elusimicrobiota bacterium]